MDNIITQFNLPKYIKGKSFSEASKLINNKFKDRNDSVSNRTKEELLQRLANAQEYVKNQNKSAEQKQQEQMQMQQQQMQSQQPQEDQEQFNLQMQQLPQKQMSYDGNINKYSFGSFLEQNSGGIGGAANGAMEMIGNLSGEGVSNNAAEAGLGGAAKGAMSGMSFGPWGAAIGGVLGGVTGLIGSAKADKKIADKHVTDALSHNNKFNSSFAYGGNINKFKLGGDEENPDPNKPQGHMNFGQHNEMINLSKLFQRPIAKSIDIPKSASFSNDKTGQSFKNAFNNETELNLKNSIGHPVNSEDKKGYDWLKGNFGSILRGAPVVTDALQLINMKKQAYETRKKLDKRYDPKYVDEMSLQNLVQNEYNNTAESLANATNGSLGSLRSNILGAQLNKTKSLSDSYMKADNINRSENEKSFRYGLETDKFNVGQDNLEKDINARNQGAYETEKSKIISSLSKNLGKIGKEKVSAKRIGKMFGYDVEGDYIIDKDGTKIKAEDFIKKYKNKKPSTSTNPFFNQYTMK